MHSTTGQTTSTGSAASSTANTANNPTGNVEQYHYPPISTLRRPSRPSNIDLSVFDIHHSSQSNDPGIYSAPIVHLKQSNNTNHHHLHHLQSTAFNLSPHHPHTATFHYQPQQQQQHMPLASHHHPQQHNLHQYSQQAHHPQQQQQQQQQQQHLLDPFSQHQHTPHTFPLQASSNHYHHYFHFPPANQNLTPTNNATPPAYNQLTLQANVPNNGHHSPLNHRPNAISSSTANTSQPSTPTHNNRLLSVQMQEQQHWSNPVLSPLMVKRMNENSSVVSSMHIDDDEDPSASIDALVADVDSTPHDLLDDQQNKSESKPPPSTTPLAESHPNTISPSPHLYLRGTSHILTTPPNPLASNDHPDNQLPVTSNFQKTFSPIHSAGFELNNGSNVRTSFFTFENSVLEDNAEKKKDNQEKSNPSMLLNADERLNPLANPDENSNQSSPNSSKQNGNSRTFSQILQPSGDKTEIKLDSLQAQTNLSPPQHQQQQINRHFCNHPECTKIFANKSALAKHKLTHCQDRKHKCIKCNKGFKRLDHLHGHMLTHEEEKPHKCRVPDCNRTYCDARSLKRHIENAHQNILAAIHEGGHEEYRTFLPETAYVKTKDTSGEFTMDSMENSSSPHSSSMENDPVYSIRNGQKLAPTYTFDEEKCVECQICKKSFKNGAALNGHMRLHGGFNEKQPIPSSTDPSEKKKRPTSSANSERRQLKRKRTNSPTPSSSSSHHRLQTIKNEEEEILMLPSNHLYQQTMYPTLPPCSDVLKHRFYDRSSATSSSRTRSISSSVIPPQVSYPIKNPMSVQPPPVNLPKVHRKPVAIPAHFYDRNNNHYYGLEDSLQNRLNYSNGMLRFDHLANPQIFPNVPTMPSTHEEKIRKTLSAEEPFKYYHPERPMESFSPTKSHPATYPYFRSTAVQHHPATFPPLPVSTHPSPNIFHQILRHTNEIFNKEFYLPRPDHLNPIHPTLDESLRYQSSTSPYPTHIYHSPSPRIVHSPAEKVPNPTSSVINTPVTSPYSNLNLTHPSPSASSIDMCNNSSAMHSMQSSPLTNPSSSLAAPKKRILNALKQEAQDEQQNLLSTQEYSPIIEHNLDETPTLKIIPDNDSPVVESTSTKKSSTPSSSSSTINSSTSSSSTTNTHFNYENLPQTDSSKPASFQWPSQFRRLHEHIQTSSTLPRTPYTPPPMLSPFRKGPGLYYQVFSQSTPAPVATPVADETSGAKINIGRDYQAEIPRFERELDDSQVELDEVLFSPSQLQYLDEQALEKYEQLNRTNPLLFSPRHSPTLYPIELVYMLLHEYNGDLQRTLAALLDGTAQDIKQCRPIHRYQFPECETWTKEETDAFTKAIDTSEKNFGLVSRAVGTKTVKQCIEFHYMPKVNLTNSFVAKRKRWQMMKNKQLFDDETSASSSGNEFRLDEEGCDNSSTTLFTCDIDNCSESFTSERAYRAHRNDHRRIKMNSTPPIPFKRNRNLDLNK